MTWWETQKEDWEKMGGWWVLPNFLAGLSLCIMGLVGMVILIFG
jgi:hypothetical protein